MKKRIAVDCLSCGHCRSFVEAELEHYGLSRDTSLVVLTKRLVCSECGSRSVLAFRFEDDGEQQKVLSESPSVVPDKE